MENITLGQISSVLAFLVALLTALGFLYGKMKKVLSDGVNKALGPLNKKLDEIDKKIDNVDMNATKNFIIARFEEIKRGDEIDEITKQRLYEQYEHYIKQGGNSYIKECFEDLRDQHKI